jgi:hypothetical protein
MSDNPLLMADALSPGADLSKVYGEETRCPICGAFAKAVPHPEHRWVCAVCGAPRIEMVGVPEESLVALREASTAQRTAALQRLTTWMTGVPAGFTLLLAIVLAPASFIASGVLIAMGVVLAVLSSRASRRAGTERKRLRGAVDHAYEAAILHLTTKDKTPSEIAATLHIAEADVEAALATEGQVRIAPMTRIADPVTESESESGSESESAAEAGAEKRK